MSAIVVTGGEEFAEIANAASEYFALSGSAEVELIYCDEEEIRELNERTRGVDKSTDVLSFPSLSLAYGRYKPFTAEFFPFDLNPDSGCVTLGSIAVCGEVAAKQAAEYGHGEKRERGYLFLHGLLHLLGFDHVEEDEKKAMREAEENILKAVGLSRAGDFNTGV